MVASWGHGGGMCGAKWDRLTWGIWGAEWGSVGPAPVTRGSHRDGGVEKGGSGAMFFGLHERQLDDKGRVALPARYRDGLGDRCFLAFGDRCLDVHVADEFEASAGELRDE